MEEALEMIRCALINLDNLAFLTRPLLKLEDSVPFKLVKMQLEEAEKILVKLP